jgi:hypothetical protein
MGFDVGVIVRDEELHVWDYMENLLAECNGQPIEC